MARSSTALRYARASGKVRKYLLYAAGTIVAAGLAWMLVTGLLVRQEATQLRDKLAQVQVLVAEGKVPQARQVAATIPPLAAHAHTLTSGPAWWTAAHVPYAGRPVAVTRGLTSAAATLGTHGIPTLLHIATRLDPGSLRTGPRTIDLGRLQASAPGLAAADADIHTAGVRLDALPHTTWFAPVDSLHASFDTTLQGIDGYVGAAARAAHVLPTMLGAHGPKRYFVGLQNEAELRGTGGLPGAFAIVVADHGTVRFTHFESDSALLPAATGQQTRTGLNFGKDYSDAYRASDPTSLYVNSNISPNFPYAAQIWARMWEQTSGEHVDGAIALDPQVLANLLAATGPITVPGGTAAPQGIVLSSTSVVPLTEQQQYTLFPNTAERKTFLVGVLKAVAGTITSGAANPALLAHAISTSALEQRMLVWTDQPAVNRVLDQTNYSGVIPDDDRPFVGLVLNNNASGKLDYYLHRSLSYERVGCGATRDMVVTIRLTNDAPATGLPPYVDTRHDPDAPETKPGDNRTLLDYFATSGAQLVSVTVGGAPATSAVFHERGHPVFRMDLELPRGTTRIVVLHLTEPAGQGPLQVWRQPGVIPLAVHGLDQSCG